jgi:hypothetical protein
MPESVSSQSTIRRATAPNAMRPKIVKLGRSLLAMLPTQDIRPGENAAPTGTGSCIGERTASTRLRPSRCGSWYFYAPRLGLFFKGRQNQKGRVSACVGRRTRNRQANLAPSLARRGRQVPITQRRLVEDPRHLLTRVWREHARRRESGNQRAGTERIPSLIDP